MKRLRFAIGLALLVAPAAAGAVDCETFGSPAPISNHYVQRVVDRADDGLAYADEARGNEDFFPFYLPTWARHIAATMARVIDSRQSLTVREAGLSSTTACLRYDELIIECKMDEVGRALDEQLRRGSFFGIMQLQSLMEFLQERLAVLDAGAQDGTVKDVGWEDQRLFDRDAPEPLEEPLCPFHSDYTPARTTGYGCDIPTLESIVSATNDGTLPFAEAELQALRTVDEQVASFREIIPLLRSAASGNDAGSNGDEAPPYEHKTVVGCQEYVGACSDDDGLACGSDEFCASKDKGYCVRNTSSPTIPKRALRGAFSYPTDHLRILTDFVQKRIEDGLSRTFPDEWKRTENLPAGATDERAERDADTTGALGMGQSTMRVFFDSVSGMQGRREGGVFAEATDAQLEIADALSDMRASIGELSRLSSQKTGVRAFVVDFAYFLRRTCVFRPCQRSLEQVIRVSLEDACFPYTNGQFLSDTAENPRWVKCAKAACIRVDDQDGNPIDLPDSCDDVLLP